MQKELKTQIQINANPNQVWDVLIDFENHSKWNPFVRSISGDVKEGNKIKVLLGPEGEKPMSFTPRVLAFKTAQEFRWLGHLLIPGIFDGEHYFELLENVDGTTTFIHGERFKGILVGMMAKKLDTDIRQGFEAMNRALKKQVEAVALHA
jgi:hypothetical protein